MVTNLNLFFNHFMKIMWTTLYALRANPVSAYGFTHPQLFSDVSIISAFGLWLIYIYQFFFSQTFIIRGTFNKLSLKLESILWDLEENICKTAKLYIIQLLIIYLLPQKQNTAVFPSNTVRSSSYAMKKRIPSWISTNRYKLYDSTLMSDN